MADSLNYFKENYAVMKTDKGRKKRVPVLDLRTSENVADPDDLRSVNISLINQNGELVQEYSTVDMNNADKKHILASDLRRFTYESDSDSLDSIYASLID